MNAAADFQGFAASVCCPDIDQAKRFLTLLDEDADFFTFQTFDDDKSRKDQNLVKVLNGTIAEQWDELCRLNALGAGVFFTVNETDGKGRKLGNITRVRAIWQEQDRPGCPELPIEPHITVESSPGKHHRYVLIDAPPLDGFRGLQDRLVESYGSDPNAADLSRVLRLPGFFHQKDPAHPYMVRIVDQSNALPISYQEAQRLFPPVVRKPKARQESGQCQPTINIEEVKSALSASNPDLPYHDWLNVGMGLHDAFGGGADGLQIWDDWSSNGDSYRPGECEYKWQSFTAGNGITIKTVFGMAAEVGWRWNTCAVINPDIESNMEDHARQVQRDQEEWRKRVNSGSSTESESPKTIDPAKLLEAFEVQREYVEKLGKEKFLIPNLLIRQHILVVVAMSGGAKTTFFFRYVAPELARQGCTVWYCDADSPPSEHKVMKELADGLHSFKFLNIDANEGMSIGKFKQTLHLIADSNSDLSDWVFIFDTLKKFADLMAKNSVKEFFSLCRRLAARGASIVLLAHANKFRSPEGYLIPEGTGDVRSDTDDLIIFERTKHPGGGIDVTTVVDPDRNAKVRGLFTPFSFRVDPDREITLHKFPLSIVDTGQTSAFKATDDEILDAAVEFLEELTEPVMQKLFVSRVCDLTGAGEKRVRTLIVQNSERKDAEPKKGWRFWYTVGERGRMEYELPRGEAAPCQNLIPGTEPKVRSGHYFES